jgi:hypothetical protein
LSSINGLEKATRYLAKTLAKDAVSPMLPVEKRACMTTLVKCRLRRLMLLRNAPESALRGKDSNEEEAEAPASAFGRAKWLLLPECQVCAAR